MALEIGSPQIKSSINLASVKKASYGYSQIILILVMCGLFYWFLVRAKLTQWNEKKTELVKITQELNGVQENLKQLNNLVKKLEDNQIAVKNLDEALPVTGKNYYVQQLIEQYATEANVSLNSLHVPLKADYIIGGNKTLLSDPYKKSRSLQRLPCNLVATGNMPGLYNFLKKLETSARVFVIKNFTIASGKEDAFTMNFDCETYFYE